MGCCHSKGEGAEGKTASSLSLADVARHLGGNLEGIEPPGPCVHGIAPLDQAGPDQITFLADSRQAARYRAQVAATKAAAVIASPAAGALPVPVIRCEHSYLGLMAALRLFHPERRPLAGIHPSAFVHEEACVDPSAAVGPLAVVEAGAVVAAGAWVEGQCYVGPTAVVREGAHLHPRVSLLDGCRIGRRSIIHSGAVIGSDGFGFHSTAQGHAKVPQVGIVEIGDDVEIGANVTIDRATMGKTTIGDGTKIDNLVHIAHNCVIGRHCIIVAQVGLSGSTTLEDRVTLAGQVGTAGHLTVGHDTVVAARGVVTQDVAPRSFVSGFPLKPHHEEKKIMMALRRLPDLLKTVRDHDRILRPDSSEDQKR
jgi:UDP-3-O-[3-hydroxymyristoyl] glucosamine N-acyltransferase